MTQHLQSLPQSSSTMLEGGGTQWASKDGVDLLYLSLCEKVLRVSSKSYVPVARILRENLSDTEIYDLFNEFNAELRKCHSNDDEWECQCQSMTCFRGEGDWKCQSKTCLAGKPDWQCQAKKYRADETDWECELEWENKQLAKATPVKCPKLQAKIDKARARHAERLRDYDMVDVDVIYSNSDIKLLKVDMDDIMLSVSYPHHRLLFLLTLLPFGRAATCII